MYGGEGRKVKDEVCTLMSLAVSGKVPKSAKRALPYSILKD
jgi:hypothetical protein